MTTLSDLIFVAYFAVAGPLIDYLVFWPAFRRRLEADPDRTRARLWGWSIISAWVLVAIGAALWTTNDRSWTELGFSVPDGWRLWASFVLFLLLVAYHVYVVVAISRSAEAKASV